MYLTRPRSTSASMARIVSCIGTLQLSGSHLQRPLMQPETGAQQNLGSLARADALSMRGAECHYQASVRSDSLAEGSEFELPVPIYEQSDDSIRLSLVTSRRNCKALLPRSALLVRFRRRVTH